MTPSYAPNNSAASSRIVLLPSIPELFNPRFLDVLLPHTAPIETATALPTPGPSNPMMDALKTISRQTFTANMAPAYSGTDSAVLDAFTTLSAYSTWNEIETYLNAAWKEDPNMSLRLIWNLRSIHDGKGEKEAFYRAFGWLYQNHPRTAISNLALLVEPVCDPPKKKKRAQAMSHGYWKDLLNILALETVGELSNISSPSTFLHAPRAKFTYRRCTKKRGASSSSSSQIEASVLANARAKEAASVSRKIKIAQSYERLCAKLAEPKFRALFIAVARLFSDQLLKDIDILQQLKSLKPDEDRIAHLKKLSLAGKWAPSPGASHDRVTNISTAIAELIYASRCLPAYPSILNTSISDYDRAHVLRSFYQRWLLTELRRAQCCPEPLMSANRWTEIKYNRVSSVCMKNNKDHFFKHDPSGFEKYLVDVESGRKTISGATLLPHELVAEAMAAENTLSSVKSKFPALLEVKKKRAAAQIRVIESQWKTLISNLRDSGSIENAIAICDVSGSMGSLHGKLDKKDVSPIFPAVSLSLVLASLAKPPFNGGFITFSVNPQFVTLDLEKPLGRIVNEMIGVDWEMNTDFSAVFLKLLLPLAVENKVKPEDMIKRLFVFSDMQFDSARSDFSGRVSEWETNYDVVEKAYEEAGYEVPQIVYWDLSVGSRMTKEVESSTKKGVAMMNGFSPAMLKVFMGEEEEGEEEWEKVDEDGETAMVVERDEDEFNPINVMKKALMKASFGGLVVVD